MNDVTSFTFIVLTYNHERYIVEHLESIKFLIENHGKNIKIDLIITDDASRDNTVALANFWLIRNRYLFHDVFVLSDGKNRGTCKNLTRALEKFNSERCKITAGDDIYSYENIFVLSNGLNNSHILSGLPLNLIDGDIKDSRFDLFNLLASNIVYRKFNYITRLQRINFFNSPSIFYHEKFLTNEKIRNFINEFSVTEDYPLQIAIAELHKYVKFVQINKVFVYYRRTAGSTYIVKNSEFTRDKVRIYDYLIHQEKNVVEQFLIKNRLYCFKLNSGFLNKLLNIGFYLYGALILRSIIKIYTVYKNLNIDIKHHQEHYRKIMTTSQLYQTEFNKHKLSFDVQ